LLAVLVRHTLFGCIAIAFDRSITSGTFLVPISLAGGTFAVLDWRTGLGVNDNV
jgi:hypothetical protein